MDLYSSKNKIFKFLRDTEGITGWKMKADPRYVEEQGQPLLNPNQPITNKTIIEVDYCEESLQEF